MLRRHSAFIHRILPATSLLLALLLFPAVARGFSPGVRIDLAAGFNPEWLAVGDLNGDGKLDLVDVNRASSTLSVFLGDGAGGFSAKTDYATTNGPSAVAIEDLNGD